MESKVVVVHADVEPVEGIANPGPHQIYKNPRVSVETREYERFVLMMSGSG
jgi:(R,R)-butanediol dehydrogenase/meso-butanediol dehydrogenase/diacetyl reductase